MSKTKILVGFIILLCMLFAVFEFIGISWLSDTLRGLIVPSITVLFFVNNDYKVCSFAIFLVIFSFAELLSLLDLMPFLVNNMPYSFFYYLCYLCNGLYALAYCFLVYNIVKTLNIKIIVKNFFIHLLVLGVLNAYLLQVLFEFTKPNSLTLGQIFIELSYSFFMLLVLSTSLINFLYKDTQKSLFMFLGSLCLVFAEVIQIAYLYFLTKILLDVFYTTLLVLGFYLFYRQAFLSEEKTSALSGNEVYK